jgi:ribosomal protein S12 methylthiotransferase
MKQTAVVITNGCPENRIDGARTEQFLIQNGWKITRNFKKSDLIVFNACGLTECSQEASINIIKQLKKYKMRDSRLIVCGCLPKINRERIKEIYSGDIFGGDDIQKLADRLGINGSAGNIYANYLIGKYPFSPSMASRIKHNFKNLLSPYTYQRLLLRNEYRQIWDTVNIVQPDTFYIKISSGCSNFCSYCAVKLSRGNINSKSIEQIVQEFSEGLKLGYKQFALIGTDTGSYGLDIQTNLISLLRAMISVKGEYWLKLRNVHPHTLIKMLPDFLDVFKSGKIVHMTSAVQHGNNHILKLMKRGYKIEDLKYAINAVKDICPKLKIRTQLMVGFPGETDAQFNDTLNLLNEIRFDFIEVYKYSPRANTRAAEMPNQVPNKIANKRYFILDKKVLDHLKSDPCHN